VRALFWKDYRLVRSISLAGLVGCILPYLMIPWLRLGDGFSLVRHMFEAGHYGMMATCFVVTLLSADIFYDAVQTRAAQPSGSASCSPK
jgi:hypothetical protein